MIITDLISGIVMLLISIYVYVSALSFPKAEYQLAGPAFYPQLMAILLALISVTLIYRSVRRLKNKEECRKVKVDNPAIVIAVMAVTLLYILVLKTLGFLITTFLYLTALVFIMQPEKKKIVTNLLVSSIMTGAVYVIFAKLFSASLPQGILF